MMTATWTLDPTESGAERNRFQSELAEDPDMAQFKFKAPPSKVVIDTETGIEIRDPGEVERVRDFIMTGDYPPRVFTLAFFDPAYQQGPIEFAVEALSRTEQETRKDGKTVSYEVWYGYKIDVLELDSYFHNYTRGDSKKIAQVAAFIREALLFRLQNTKGAAVQFV